MVTRTLLPTELILNPDNSVYHLNLCNDELADTIILVGDPNRAAVVSAHFDEVTIKKSKREFVTHTGRIGKMPISVIATGIGTSHIDIVLNEIDIVLNVDFNTRQFRDKLIKPRIIRMGTCGGLREGMQPDCLVFSDYAFAFDSMLHFYKKNLTADEKILLDKLKKQFKNLPMVDLVYTAACGSSLADRLRDICDHRGITMTCSGFYGPQHRQIRTPLIEEDIFEMAKGFEYRDDMIANIEMETAAIYGLGEQLGFDCYSVSVVVGNRLTQKVSKDPVASIEKMINHVLASLRT